MTGSTGYTNRRKLSPGAALGLGIAAGFAVLFTLGAAAGVVPPALPVLAGSALAVAAAVAVALGVR